MESKDSQASDTTHAVTREATAFDPKALPLSERKAILGLFTTLSNAVDREKEVQEEFLTDLGQRLGLSDKQAERIRKVASRKVDPSPFVASLRGSATKYLILWDSLTATLLAPTYDARSREGLRRLALALDVPWSEVAGFELRMLEAWQAQAGTGGAVAVPEADSESAGTGTLLGAAVAGGVLLAAGAFLAAPAVGGALGVSIGLKGAAAVSAGLAKLGGGALSAGGFGMAGGKAAIAAIGGAFGAYAGARTIAKRKAGLSEFTFEPLGNPGMLPVIGISGFLSQLDDYRKDWGGLSTAAPWIEPYALRWDSKAARDLGNLLSSITGKVAISQLVAVAAQKGIKAAAGLPLFVPTIALQFIELLDNPWHAASNSAQKAGVALADTLRGRGFGARPVTLVGFSLGAKVIFRALESLGRSNDLGLVHDAILMGGAFDAGADEWQHARNAVAGRLVNAYSSQDWILSILFRIGDLKPTAAGLGPIVADGVENVDVTHLAPGHRRYRKVMTALFTRIGIDSPYRISSPAFFV